MLYLGEHDGVLSYLLKVLLTTMPIVSVCVCVRACLRAHARVCVCMCVRVQALFEEHR